MILLDTNIVSAMMSVEVDQQFSRWLSEQRASQFYTSRFVEAEIRYGIALLPSGKKQSFLSQAADVIFLEHFTGKMLSINPATVMHYAQLAAKLQQAGHNIGITDVWIAAQALEHNARLVTRNIKHFKPCGVKLINPFV